MHQPEEIIKDRYRILHPLGTGGIATTYAAQNLDTGQNVAIKALSLRRLKDWKSLELFEREGKVLSQLNHPGIPKYLDYFQLDTDDDRRFYIVQEIVPGKSLQDWVESGWHPTELEVREIGEQLLEILVYLHQINPPVIHRDIKPPNIIRQSDGKILLIDFGAVKDTYRHTMTSGSTVVGTYGYMAPEQFRGQVKPASDLYSLGATLVFVLTGRSPVDLPQVRMKIDFRNRVSISPQFADWLDKMLEPMLEDRFTSAGEALDGLNNEIASRGNGEFVESDRPISNIVSTRQQKPAGSEIVFTDNGTDLLIEIPRKKSQKLGGLLLLIITLAAGVPMFVLVFESSSSGPDNGLVGFLFLVFFVGTIIATLKLMLEKVILKINASRLRLEWLLGNSFMFGDKTISTNQIDKVGLSTIKDGKACTIWQGVKPIKFGAGLSEIEQEWLVEEIRYFLNQIRQ
jgi:serine/threonine protein kinase